MDSLVKFLFGGIAFCMYLFARNAMVFSHRMKVLDRCRIAGNLDEYNALPSYNMMMLKFWVWPMSRFEKQEAPRTNLKMVK